MDHIQRFYIIFDEPVKDRVIEIEREKDDQGNELTYEYVKNQDGFVLVNIEKDR